MLAVKLHKKALPWLGSGSHLVPIVRWGAGKLQVRRWHYLLTASRTTPWPNNQVHFPTMVQISDELPGAMQRRQEMEGLRHGNCDFPREFGGSTALRGCANSWGRIRSKTQEITLRTQHFAL